MADFAINRHLNQEATLLGNGTGDDGPEIEAALNRLHANGGVLEAPAMTCLINSTVTWPGGSANRNIIVRGTGKHFGAGGTSGCTRFVAGSGLAGAPMFDCTGGSTPGGVSPYWQGKFHNCAFINGGGNGPAVRANAILGGGFRDCSFNGFGEDAVDIWGEIFYSQNEFNSCVFNDSQFHVRGNVNGTVFRGFQFTRCGWTTNACMLFSPNGDTGSGPTIDEATFDDTRCPAIETAGQGHVTINNIYMEKVNVNATPSARAAIIFNTYNSNLIMSQLSVDNVYCRLAGSGHYSGQDNSQLALVNVVGSGAQVSISKITMAHDSPPGFLTRWSTTTNSQVGFNNIAAIRNDAGPSGRVYLSDGGLPAAPVKQLIHSGIADSD